ncbi:DNA glycosylase [Xylaria intraflava]|nr:DNA glycosylase [Xylaria intraflava]
MKEEADDAGESPEPAKPSFSGRLQLSEFMFDDTSQPSQPSHARRRSPRLLLSQPSGTTSSESPTPPSHLEPRPARQKRKSPQSTAPRNGSDSPSPRKKRTRPPAAYAPPSTYQHLPPLVDKVAPNLLVLFVGLNPGITTAREGHAYAHPSNLFWKLLFSSGLTPVPCRPEEDHTLPKRFSLGNTNIVSRPSRNGAELSKAEMDAGVAILEEKCRRWRPEVMCVVGKSIWESIFRVWHGRNMARGEFEYGWQTKRIGAVPPADDSALAKTGASVVEGLESVSPPTGSGEGEDEKVDDGPWEGSRIFVATSTSGLAATLSRAEKERIWKILGDWCVQRREERAAAATKADV